MVNGFVGNVNILNTKIFKYSSIEFFVWGVLKGEIKHMGKYYIKVAPHTRGVPRKKKVVYVEVEKPRKKPMAVMFENNWTQ